MVSRPDAEWEKTIRENLSFLFTSDGGKVLKSERYPKLFGNKSAVVQVGSVLLKISNDRGLLEAEIAPEHSPAEWELITLAVASLDMENEDSNIPPRPSFGTFVGLSQLLAPRINQLHNAFSPTNYPETKRKMHKMHGPAWQGRLAGGWQTPS